MIMNNIRIIQSGNNYLLYLPTNVCVCQLVMPPDNSYLADARGMEYITKAIAIRWQVFQPKQKNHNKD